MDTREILERIDRRRCELGLSFDEVGRRAGCSVSLIHNWRNGLRLGKRVNMTAGSLEGVAAALGINAEWLRTGQGEPGPVPQNDDRVPRRAARLYTGPIVDVSVDPLSHTAEIRAVVDHAALGALIDQLSSLRSMIAVPEG